MTGSDSWHDWIFSDSSQRSAEAAMRELARYANPDQVRRLGLGLGGGAAEQSRIARAERLAERLAGSGIRYTVEPFNPRQHGGQIVRTTPELLEGAGTCLDFAVSVAALCVGEDIPVVLAHAVPTDPTRYGHAFVVVQEPLCANGSDDEKRDPLVYAHESFRSWASAFENGDGRVRHALIETTPVPHPRTGRPLDLAARRARTMELLRNNDGVVHAVHVQAAVAVAGGWLALPEVGRDLGITGWLPDPPADLADFPTRAALLRELGGVDGTVVVAGERGTGKSTLALQLALQHGKGHGWYLDGSDPATLRRSLAAAEARCRGQLVDNDQDDNLGTLGAAARRRLVNHEGPWVVVVDNADRPAEVMDLLPVPRREQLLVVTTTDLTWARGMEQRYRVTRLERLAAEDLDDATRGLRLRDEELLPGLVRIARACDPDRLAATEDRPPGVDRLVRAALGDPLPDTPMARAVVAASFMPAEQITVGWLAGVLGDRHAAVTAARQAQTAGLVEHSRYAWGIQHDDETPLWMHRSVRRAVRDLAGRDGAPLGLTVLGAHHTGRRRQRYSVDELADLAAFVRGASEDHPGVAAATAATAVMNLLEPLGSEQSAAAAELAASVLPHTDVSTLDGLEMYGLALMARARPVNYRDDATAEQLDEAIEWCRLASAACGDTDDREKTLLRGRADAMLGILLKKRAVLTRDDDGDDVHGDRLRQVIEVLEQSYRSRRSALTETNDGVTRLRNDPDQHVDRGWYNLGGAYLDLANHLVDRDPARLVDALTSSLRAYLGSLSLRRGLTDSDTRYTAASLWGCALALYTAALHCPGELDLTGLPPTPELDPVSRRQDAWTLLRAAEECVLQALQVWAQIDGPRGGTTNKARALHRKVSLAWPVAGRPREQRAANVRKGVEPFLTDLRLSWDDL